MQNFEQWSEQVSAAIAKDPLWRVRAYQLSLFVADLGWQDVTTLMQDRRTRDLADQLYRALGSIGANIAEGYSRGTGRDRARFYEYALGSARESRTWYYNARHLLGEAVSEHRMRLLTHVIRLLLTSIPNQRDGALYEPSPMYATDAPETRSDEELASLAELLTHVPQAD